MEMRTERDSMGEKEIPAGALYGVTSARSMENFDAAGRRLPLEIIRGIVQIKQACALANHDLGLLSPEKTQAIVAACGKALSGAHDDAFVVEVFQAGSGTSSNMNVNEVLGNLANLELGGKPGDRHLVHPNDDVNKGQSTNNVFPSGIKVACVNLTPALLAEADATVQSLRSRAARFAHVRKTGRTHLQDAVPITVEQEMRAWARALEKSRTRVAEAADRLLELGVGGNAVGTGINTKAAFRGLIMKHLSEITGSAYRVAEDGLEITQFLTDLGQYGAALKLLALDLGKMANDLRLLVSGPNTAIGEYILPAVEPGSSIMPGKINPSICEAANMACLYVVGMEAAVAAGVGAGQLQLNTHMPLVGDCLVQAAGLLARTLRMVRTRCVEGIEVDEARCQHCFDVSAGLATVLNPTLGYDKVAALVKESLKTGETLRQIVLRQKIMGEDALEDLLSRSTGPTL